jgi:hypothetical protein
MYTEPKTLPDYLHVVGLDTPPKRAALGAGVATLLCYAARWPTQCFTSTGKFRTWDPRPSLHAHTEDDDDDDLPTQVPFFAIPVAVAVVAYLFT